MPIVPRLDRVLLEKKMQLNDLSDQVDITYANLSRIKSNKIKAVRFTTLEAICLALKCQPGELFELVDEDGNLMTFDED